MTHIQSAAHALDLYVHTVGNDRPARPLFRGRVICSVILCALCRGQYLFHHTAADTFNCEAVVLKAQNGHAVYAVHHAGIFQAVYLRLCRVCERQAVELACQGVRKVLQDYGRHIIDLFGQCGV